MQGENVLERDDINTIDDCTVSEVRPGGRFQTGQSGNPAGRPRGARNKVTLKAEGKLAENADAIMEVLVRLAKEADLRALRMCIDRLIPLRRERTVSIAMPEIKTLSDARSASSTLVTACLNGEISPVEAREVLSVISEHFKICEFAEIEQKLQTLEARLQTALQGAKYGQLKQIP